MEKEILKNFAEKIFKYSSVSCPSACKDELLKLSKDELIAAYVNLWDSLYNCHDLAFDAIHYVNFSNELNLD